MKQTVMTPEEYSRAQNTSPYERMFARQVEDAQLPPPERDYLFYPGRRWRFDFCWVPQHLAVEIEGGIIRNRKGIWVTTHGHASANRYMSDIEKYNAAAVMVFCLLRFPGPLVENGTGIREVNQWFAAIPERMVENE